MDTMKRKLASRKFLVAVGAAAAAFVASWTGHDVPWEFVTIAVSYIAGEAGVDVVRDIRQAKKP